MTLDDWGRMGRLLLDGTGADGAQVIAPDWLAFMKAPSPRDPEYGGPTWLNRADGSDSDGPTPFPDAAPDTVVSMIGPPGTFVTAGPGAAPHAPGPTDRRSAGEGKGGEVQVTHGG